MSTYVHLFQHFSSFQSFETAQNKTDEDLRCTHFDSVTVTSDFWKDNKFFFYI